MKKPICTTASARAFLIGDEKCGLAAVFFAEPGISGKDSIGGVSAGAWLNNRTLSLSGTPPYCYYTTATVQSVCRRAGACGKVPAVFARRSSGPIAL